MYEALNLLDVNSTVEFSVVGVVGGVVGDVVAGSGESSGSHADFFLCLSTSLFTLDTRSIGRRVQMSIGVLGVFGA